MSRRSSSSNNGVRAFLRSLLAADSNVSRDTSERRSAVNSSDRLNVLKWMVIALIIPSILNFGALQREERAMKVDKFDIGFRQSMFMNCSGEGLPTVVLDSPIGMTSDVWAPVVHHLKGLTKVCVYDRPGLGRSDAPKVFNASDPGEGIVAKVAGEPFTALRTVHDLHRLLTFSFPQEKPFLLVGSEIGAVNMLMYSKIHSEQVFGLLLINPVTNSLFDQTGEEDSWELFRDSSIIPRLHMFRVGALSGLNRLAVLAGILRPFKDYESNLPEDVLLREKHHLCNPSSLGAVLEEYLKLKESTNQLERSLSLESPINGGVTVMTGNYYDELYPPFLNEAWSKSAQDLISKLPGCQQLIINGANRSMIITHPQEIISPIRRMVKKYRSNEARMFSQ
eukprot:TRINITY_DN3482_c0_g1_i1.p1 TRINITY_DN3482_c0_g1~~TRINITY_DN3482_c0_g1_i1.p1  ORF type:complete len:394 (-),score=57.25 TRINITY_DN3482_c0_g1_i1:270-1451(-)